VLEQSRGRWIIERVGAAGRRASFACWVRLRDPKRPDSPGAGRRRVLDDNVPGRCIRLAEPVDGPRRLDVTRRGDGGDQQLLEANVRAGGAWPLHHPVRPKTTLRMVTGVAVPHPTSVLDVRAQLVAVHVPTPARPPRAVL
jgi:hypothetical protein